MEQGIAFLRQKAEQLRAIAAAEPQLGDNLRRLAEELDEIAGRLAGRRSAGGAAAASRGRAS